MDMRRSSGAAQRGFSFFMLILVIALLAFVGAIAAQAFPTVMEYQAIRKAVERSKDGATPQEIRNSFDKAAAIDDIKSITGKDLDIKREGERTVVRFAYTKEIPIWGPAFLLLKYSGQSK